MVIYVNVDNCRLGFCPVHAAVAGFAILVSAYLAFYRCLLLVCVYFIDCKCKIDFRRVYGLTRYIYRCVYVPVRAVTLYFWFLSRFISSPDKV